MHVMGAAPSPWRPPPDSDAGTFATQSVAMVNKFDRAEVETLNAGSTSRAVNMLDWMLFNEGTEMLSIALTSSSRVSSSSSSN